MSKVLIIEDDDVIARGMTRHLQGAGFDAISVANGETGIQRLRFERPDVCVLDLMLPGLDGWRVIEQARNEGIGTPIVVVSARGTEHDRVHALELGADDYLVKPFGLRELIARIRAVTRRVGGASDGGEAIVAGDLTVDLRSHRARLGDDELQLTPKEFDLLALLAREAGALVTRERILRDVWQTSWYGSSKTVDVHVASLRRKLGDPRWIETVRGIGLRLHVV